MKGLSRIVDTSSVRVICDFSIFISGFYRTDNHFPRWIDNSMVYRVNGSYRNHTDSQVTLLPTRENESSQILPNLPFSTLEACQLKIHGVNFREVEMTVVPSYKKIEEKGERPQK